jgi:hypothetical protein
MEKLKALFGSEALTWEQLEAKLKDNKEVKLANLAGGEYVAKKKFDDKEAELLKANETIKGLNETVAKFDGVDLEKLKKDASDWENKYNTDIAAVKLDSAVSLALAEAKAKNPKRFCDSGLYKIVRCPNYLGEVLFWTGVFVSSVTSLSGAWQWAGAIIGYVCIVYIMFGGARRLEIRQNKNYGQDPEYREYVKKTPILLPFIPLYSVEKYKWLVG